MSQHVFVDSFPIEESRAVAEAIIARQFTVELVKPAWVVAEYAMIQFLPSGLVGAEVSDGARDLEQVDGEAVEATAVMEALIAHVENTTNDAPLSRGLVPWVKIFVVIVKAILELRG